MLRSALRHVPAAMHETKETLQHACVKIRLLHPLDECSHVEPSGKLYHIRNDKISCQLHCDGTTRSLAWTLRRSCFNSSADGTHPFSPQQHPFVVLRYLKHVSRQRDRKTTREQHVNNKNPQRTVVSDAARRNFIKRDKRQPNPMCTNAIAFILDIARVLSPTRIR